MRRASPATAGRWERRYHWHGSFGGETRYQSVRRVSASAGRRPGMGARALAGRAAQARLEAGRLADRRARAAPGRLGAARGATTGITGGRTRSTTTASFRRTWGTASSSAAGLHEHAADPRGRRGEPGRLQRPADPLIRHLSRAVARRGVRGWRVEIDDHPIEESPFAPASFDLVVMINVLDHVRTPISACGRRWARPAGRILPARTGSER